MISAQCPDCQASFNLKDELAGKMARCPNCSKTFEVSVSKSIDSNESGTFSQHTYGIKQKRIALKEKYYVRDAKNTDLLFAVRDLKFFQSLFAIFAAIATWIVLMGLIIVTDDQGIPVDAAESFQSPQAATLTPGNSTDEEVPTTIRRSNRKIQTVAMTGIATTIDGTKTESDSAWTKEININRDADVVIVDTPETEEPTSSLLHDILVVIVLSVAFLVGMILYPKRHIRFYENDRYDSNTQPVFSIIQMKRLEFPKKHYRMEDAAGNYLATFEKNIFTNIFRRKWWIELPDGKRFVIKEDSIILSFFRRWIPIIGPFIRTNFVFFDLQTDPKQERSIGIFKRKFELFDSYLLDLSNDPVFTLPRRVAIGAAILLDTWEKR